MSSEIVQDEYNEVDYPSTKIQESTFKADFMKPVYNYISYLQSKRASILLLKQEDFKEYAVHRIMKVWFNPEFHIKDEKESKTLEEFEKSY